MTSLFEDLGARVAAEQDAVLARDSAQLARVRHRVLSPPPARVPLGRGLLLALGIVAAAAIVGVALWAWPAGEPALSYALADGTAGTVGATLRAPADGTLELAFTDGTTVSLAPESALTVAELGAQDARLELTTGTATFAVEKGHQRRWAIDAGRFTVHVTGTRFDVAWSPTRGEFSLDLREGHVLVTGPLLGQGRSVVAGERVRVSLTEERVEFGAATAATEAAAAAEPEDVARDEDARPQAAPTARRSGASASRGGAAAQRSSAGGATEAATGPDAAIGESTGAEGVGMPSVAGDTGAEARDWRELSADGRFKEAMRKVDGQGFSSLVAAAPADGLSALGDTARLAGDWQRARVAYLALRERYAGTREAQAASFFLGRIDFDRRGAFLESAGWFERYLTEAPEGSFAQQALGRLVEAWQRAGETGRAEATAKRYLRRYPTGAHTAIARGVLGQ